MGLGPYRSELLVDKVPVDEGTKEVHNVISPLVLVVQVVPVYISRFSFRVQALVFEQILHLIIPLILVVQVVTN